MQLDLESVRAATEPQMRCPECGSQMMACPSGLVCEQGCGRIVLPEVYTPSEVARAFPERAVKTLLTYEARTKNAVLDRAMLPPAAGQTELFPE